MMRYSVTATLDTQDTLSEYCEWLNNRHMPAVLNEGNALSGELSVVAENDNEIKVNTLYTFLNSDAMNNYLTNIAPNLSTLQECVTKFYEAKKVLNFDRFVGTTGFYYQSSNVKNPFTILPEMIRYTVIATLSSSEHLEEYTTWLSEGHIQAVVNAGGLSGEYNIIKNDDSNQIQIQVASIYTFPNLDALHGYFNGIAATLRQDGAKRFVETNKVLKFDRYVGIIKNATIHGENNTFHPVDISPYLMYKGQCRDAMNFYRQCFEGELQLLDLDSTLPNSPILHSSLILNQSFASSSSSSSSSSPLQASTIMSSDSIDGFCSTDEYLIGNNISVCMNLFSYQQISSFTSYLTQNGKILLPLAKQMWGAYFAEFTDQYSINWYLNMMIPPEFESADTTVELNKPIIIAPYLRFSGECEEAMKVYQRILGGVLELNEFPEWHDNSNGDANGDGNNGDSGGDSNGRSESKRRKKNIIHSTLTFKEGLYIMACDNCCDETQDSNIQKGNNVSVSMSFDSELAIRSCYYSLSEGGKIINPLGKPFWGGLFGQFVDKYGVHWMVTFHPKEGDGEVENKQKSDAETTSTSLPSDPASTTSSTE